jgi:hypothetical protein
MPLADQISLFSEELSASSAPPAAPKIQAAPGKKKRQNRRAIRITNTHMLEQVRCVHAHPGPVY